ncbi:MAG: hypothetical protein ACK4S4_07890 [Pyrinomonadaceae bacterium]
MALLLQELTALVDALEDAAVEYAVCGGLAMAIQGFPRATMDIDVLVREESVDEAISIAGRLGFDIRGLDISFKDPTLEIRRVSKIVEGTVLPLDLLLVTEDIETVWSSRERVPFAGRTMSVVSRDGLLLLKRRAGRPQDLADIFRIENEED